MSDISLARGGVSGTGAGVYAGNAQLTYARKVLFRPTATNKQSVINQALLSPPSSNRLLLVFCQMLLIFWFFIVEQGFFLY